MVHFKLSTTKTKQRNTKKILDKEVRPGHQIKLDFWWSNFKWYVWNYIFMIAGSTKLIYMFACSNSLTPKGEDDG